MSNIAKRIAAAVVLGLFAAGTPALAAETGVQVAQGAAGVQFEQRAVGQTGDAAAPAAAPASTPASTTQGAWYNVGSDSCKPKYLCTWWVPCPSSAWTAASGSCGDLTGSSDAVRVMGTGRDPDLNYRWICRVLNKSDSKTRTISYGVYCHY